jgi:Abnormal spindle-like microcephaly-assoc'd, ASPM-SPD-2-Hydin
MKPAIRLPLVLGLIGTFLLIGSVAWAKIVVSQSPTSLDFGSVKVGSTNQLSVAVTVTGTGRAATNKVKLTVSPTKAPFSFAPPTNYHVKKNHSLNVVVEVTFAPTKPGTFHATIQFNGTLHEVPVTGVAGLPPFATCDTAKTLFPSGSGGSISKVGDSLYATADTGESPSQIQGVLSTDGGGTWGPVFNITNDTSGDNEDPFTDHDLHGNFHITWQHTDSEGNHAIEYVKYNAVTGEISPILNLGAGKDPRIAIDGSGNPIIVYEHDGVIFQKSNDNGSTFAPPITVSSDLSAFNPLVTANSSNLFFAWSTFISGIEAENGVFSSDDGSTFTPSLTLHLGASGADLAAFGSLFFLGQVDPVVADVGAHNMPGSPSGSFAFIDFGDATGSGGFSTEQVGNGFFPASAYSRSDSTVEVAATAGITTPQVGTHLLQGQPSSSGAFSDLIASTDPAQQVSVSGDVSGAFIVQTINSIPGPIELIRCH